MHAQVLPKQQHGEYLMGAGEIFFGTCHLFNACVPLAGLTELGGITARFGRLGFLETKQLTFFTRCLTRPTRGNLQK